MQETPSGSGTTLVTLIVCVCVCVTLYASLADRCQWEPAEGVNPLELESQTFVNLLL